MKPKKSLRGFLTFADFKDTYKTKVRVSESSAADRPCIWIFLDENPSVYDPDRMQKGRAGAHLTLPQAKKLANALLYAIENHYQIKPRR